MPYERFDFPEPWPERPYTVVDMIATIDGKTVSGKRGEDVHDLGSATDHAVMRRLQDHVDGVLIGAGTLRATPSGWNPNTRFRIVMSRSGRVATDHSFFQGGEGYVAGPPNSAFQPAGGVEPIPGAGPGEIVAHLRQIGCERLLILGGSRTNGAFLGADLVDEIFLTLAPKVKLGIDLPTLAEGPELPRGALLAFTLAEHHSVGDELFLRYRRSERR